MSTEAESLEFIGFIIMAVAMTIASFVIPSGRGFMGFASAGMWLLLGIFCYTKHVDTWDIMYTTFWVSMGMVMGMSLMATIFHEGREDDIDLIETGEEGGPGPRRRTGKRRLKSSRYERTGIVNKDKKR